MADQKPARILISGMGIAGQVLAYWLLRANLGIHITFVERSADMRKTGQGVDIRVEGVDVISKMGVEQKIREATTHEGGVRFLYDNNETYAYWPASDGEFSLSSDIEIMRGQLVTILNDALPKGDIEYRYDTMITDFEEHEHSVDVTFKDGKHESFDIVLAAEGQKSSIRRLMQQKHMINGCAPHSPPGEAVYSFSFVGGIFSMPRTEQDGDDWNMCHSTGGRGLSFRPATKDLTGVYINVCDATRREELAEVFTRSVPEIKAFFRKEFEDVDWVQKPRLLDAMDNATDFYPADVGQVHLDKWSSTRGRVALVGDAAFCPTPATGKGTTLAFVGSYTLAHSIVEELRAARKTQRQPDLAAAAIGWEQSIRPYIVKSQKLFPGMPDMFNPRTKLGLSVFRRFVSSAVFFITAIYPTVNRVGKLVSSNKKEREITLPEWVDA